MAIYSIPLKATPNQELIVNLGNQNIGITLITRNNNSLYISVTADSETIINNRICRANQPLIDAQYKPINGELMIVDKLGDADPVWQDLNNRYILYWIDKDEL